MRILSIRTFLPINVFNLKAQGLIPPSNTGQPTSADASKKISGKIRSNIISI